MSLLACLGGKERTSLGKGEGKGGRELISERNRQPKESFFKCSKTKTTKKGSPFRSGGEGRNQCPYKKRERILDHPREGGRIGKAKGNRLHRRIARGRESEKKRRKNEKNITSR